MAKTKHRVHASEKPRKQRTSEETLRSATETAILSDQYPGGRISEDDSSSSKTSAVADSVDSRQWNVWLVTLSLLAVVTRLYKISEPAHVCWDETHFGKMAGLYINRTLFFDVHPPLGKMLLAASGLLFGYDGSFEFSKPGDKYTEEVPYAALRTFCGLFGAALIPLCYCITWSLSHSLSAAQLAGSLALFDTGLLTISRFILLDPCLLFFIFSCVFSYVKFAENSCRPFTRCWWMWLIITGFCLGCAVSVKFIGAFVVVLIGLSTLQEMWQLFGDLSCPLVNIAKHFVARAFCLILIPCSVYTVGFYVHFAVLNQSGPGDSFFSSAFQSQLKGNPLFNATMPESVAYGSVITLKNYRTGGGYLHSHWDVYPEVNGRGEQQVTSYLHKDDNNYWTIKPSVDDQDKFLQTEPELVRNGDIVQLEHIETRCTLRGRRQVAPLTHRHFLVSCVGENVLDDGEDDDGDLFRLEAVDESHGVPLGSVHSVFRLIHVGIGCAVQSHDKQLPHWGWEQLEVTCNPNVWQQNSLWNVEQIFDDRLRNSSFVIRSLSFLEKLLEAHAVMFRGNKSLKPKDGETTSSPWQWPLNYKGQPISGPDYRVYLLGNPIIWWGCLSSMVLFLVISAIAAILKKIISSRRPPLPAHGWQFQLVAAGQWLVLGWFLHYAPFFAMGRVLYFHHYLSAMIFSIMLTAIVWDFLVNEIVKRWFQSHARYVIDGVTYAALVYSFVSFAPLSYGVDGTQKAADSQLDRLRWLDSWNF